MRRNLLLAGFALAVIIPTAASAQETCEERSANRTTGTAVGAVAGALLGAAVAGHHEKGTGAVVGGVAGAIVGNQLARGPRDCEHAYGWYDDDGGWHANRVDQRAAYGYYDRYGNWVDGQPADWRPAPPPPPPRRADWDDRYDDSYDQGEWRGWPGYAEFRGIEAHIRGEIRDGVREDLIDRDDAHELFGQLRDIRRDEYQAYRAFGWNLPWEDRSRIRRQLEWLDRRVDQIRAEP